MRLIEQPAPQIVRNIIAFDLRRRLSSEPDAPTIMDLLQAIRNSGIGVWVFGGCVRDWCQGKSSQDIDLVVNRPIEAVRDALAPFSRDGLGEVYWNRPFGLLVWGSPERSSLDVNILRGVENQLLYMESGADIACASDPEAHVPTVDFSINTLFLDLDGYRLKSHPDSLEDIGAQRLSLMLDGRIVERSPWLPLRICKFMMRGYRPNGGCAKVLKETLSPGIETLGRDGTAKWIRMQIVRKGDPLEAFGDLVLGSPLSMLARAHLQQALELIRNEGKPAQSF